jgi:hypothetical protein
VAKSLKLTPEQYGLIDRIVGIDLNSEQFYTVVTHRSRGQVVRSFHLFARQPTPTEVTKFEDTASKVKVRGRKTEFEGSQSKAFRHLYDALIVRAYNVVSGFKILGEVPDDQKTYDPSLGLNREQAIIQVPIVVKREALRDAMGEVYSEARILELEGEDDDVKGDKEDD